MPSLRTPTPEQSHRSASSIERSAVSGAHGEPRMRTVPTGWRYEVPREWKFSWFLAVSIALFTLATCLAALLPPEEKLPPMIEVDLGFDGVEGEPPPLGDPEAGAGEVQPEPPAPEQQPEPMPEQKMEQATPEPMPEPEPEPVPEPEMKEEPVPEPAPQFEVPKEEPPPAPKPKPVEKPKPKPQVQRKPSMAPKPATAAPASTGPAGSGLATGRTGVRGSPGGKPGGRGGGRGDFVSTPSPQYDATAKQRRYQGRGMFVIRYENGRIISVSTQQSTGVPYLDSRTIAWIKSRWRVKSGTSGVASLPITWQLR